MEYTNRRSDARLWAAFVVSFSVHAVLLTALALGGAATEPAFAPQPGLWAQLVEPARAPSAAQEDPPQAPLAIRSPAAEPAAAPARAASEHSDIESTPVPPAAAAASPSAQVSATKPPRLANGHVDMTTTSTLARLGEALTGRSLSEFLPEVEKPVRLASALVVDYPPAALEARREGSVLAWVHVALDGSVKEVEIVEGEPEFADSVRADLMKVRFLPAEAYGHPVENYIILQFDFYLGSVVRTPTGDLGQRPVR